MIVDISENNKIEKSLLDNNIYKYLLDNTQAQDSVLTKMYEKAKADEHAMMITPLEQIGFLKLLIKILGAKKVLEIGCFRGVGTLGMAQA